MSVRDAIRIQRQSLLDLDIAVDDTRDEVDRAVGRLQDLVRERDRVRVHLAQLVDIANGTKTAEAK